MSFLISRALALAVCLAVFVGFGDRQSAATGELKKHYWATSLSGEVEPALLQGLRAAVARGEVGWLDVDPKQDLPGRLSGINLVLYHVGGNCYIGSDCDRFPASAPTGTRWDDSERGVDLYDPAVRRIVVGDLVEMMQRANKIMPPRSWIGVHIDNVHTLTAEGIAAVVNEYLAAITLAKHKKLISQGRVVGYIAKNNPRAFKAALDLRLIEMRPFYQVVENARIKHDGSLNSASQVAQTLSREYGIPVFLKTFGSDIAYADIQDGHLADVFVSQEMTRRMVEFGDIAGAAWSPDEGSYHPTLFVQGSPVVQTPLLLEPRE